jgi:hypothetical protein
VGGYGSGSFPRHYLVEHSRTVSVAALVRAGYLREGLRRVGGWQWQGNDARPAASIGLELDLVPPAFRYCLAYTIGHKSEPVRQTGAMVTTPLHFGGVRWWFACPRCGRRCGKLYLPPSATLFGCRRCYSLRYAVQRADRGDRLYRRARRLVQQMGGDIENPISTAAVTRKPRGMHQRTFDRLYRAFRQTLAARDAWFVAAFQHRFGTNLELLR